MKFFHLSDLHLGKRVNEYSLLEDQQYILNKIIIEAEREKPRAVLISGDVYDKPVPPVEAVKLFGDFLTSLKKLGAEVLVISGNHDSAERLSFAADLLGVSGVHISPAYDGELTKVVLSDEFGRVNFYLLPFIKPAHVSRVTGEEVGSYTAAVEMALTLGEIDYSERNVLLCHQFVTGASRCESEELSVGGLDNVDGGVFKGLDYVALGHIHGPQNISLAVRYCGTPLKYSFSEVNHKKSITVVELGKKGDVKVGTIPLKPLRDFHVIRGSYEEVTSKSFLNGKSPDDYYKITLTDEEDIPECFAKLRCFYPNLMALEYDNARTRAEGGYSGAESVADKSPLELFSELYKKQNGVDLTDEMVKTLSEIIERIWEGEN